MLYQTYQFHEDAIAPVRNAAALWKTLLTIPGWPAVDSARRQAAASLDMVGRLRLTHTRPEFGISSVLSGNAQVDVTEEILLDLPFGKLVRFAKKDFDAPQPRVLVVAPLSGHFATLLSKTAATLLRDHDVYITDWTNARDVPLTDGNFGMDDYIDYLIRFIEEIGPGAHVLAVCQPCVQTLAAVAVMSEQKHPATPRTMTLMAGPIDTRENPTAVNKLANDKPLSWFETKVTARVPDRFKGGGRKVYPGFVQLSAFIAMNAERHRNSHQKMYDHLVAGETEEANKIKEFYDEYFAVMDLTQEFYVETIDRVFQRAELATGEFTYRGKKVNPGAICKTALLTVEGGRDDICSLGQTSAAHDLCSSLRPHMKHHHLQANVGHYGTFNGKKWQNEIYPAVRRFILSME